MLNLILLWYKGKRPNTEIRGNFEEFRGKIHDPLIFNRNKKRPNTIPVFGPGKWLLGESRALKVGINAG
ncbi:hypothetical protein LO27_13055 [Salmonella enterica]|nr:hypothetical protein [Salmonella enterica]EAX7746766.1 hypothetical protein [Salmonella enterica]EAX7760516.1 hypothetical protein [Salmonella enterica]EBP1125740.1 hypothetical protein [Salmonella enterica]EBP1188738.1 hypothetical protein [Salmonella enterica]